jgi:thiol-disulfide isomerase/thioredoxin
MKKILVLLSLIIAAGCSNAQQPAKPALGSAIPTFKILDQDSAWVNNSVLKKDRPVVIIYFSPDCSHCQRMMYELKPYMKDFANAQVVMVTFIETKMAGRMLRDFRKTFSLANYPNFITGTEFPDYKLQRYYQVATTPFIAVYDRKGKLVKTFDKVPEDIKEIPEAVKKA